MPIGQPMGNAVLLGLGSVYHGRDAANEQTCCTKDIEPVCHRTGGAVDLKDAGKQASCGKKQDTIVPEATCHAFCEQSRQDAQA